MFDSSRGYSLRFNPFDSMEMLAARINSVIEGVFYYSGAATAAGQSYTGALLVTRDGSWPDEEQIDRVRKAFDTCGIKLWELFEVRRATVLSITCTASTPP